MKKLTLVFICIFLLSACKYIIVPKGLQYRFLTSSLISDSLFNMDGYYIGTIYYTFDAKTDTSYRTVLFYRDGTCGTSFTSGLIDSTELKQRIREYGYGSDKHYFNWGAYQVSRDTIRTQSLCQMYAWDYWMVNNNYKIIDRNTLVRIPSYAIYDAPNVKGIKDTYIYDTLRFVSYVNRPDSACYLKKYRWFKSG